jgi:hypothetical protein
MVSLPLFLVSSWWIYERVVLGKEQRMIEWPAAMMKRREGDGAVREGESEKGEGDGAV